jgi:folylpolyglutamate synthase/dihydropteroate synthase
MWRNRRASPRGSVVDLINPWGKRANVRVGMVGAHRCDNALLALTAVEAFTGEAMPQTVADRALAEAFVPGAFRDLLSGSEDDSIRLDPTEVNQWLDDTPWGRSQGRAS